MSEICFFLRNDPRHDGTARIKEYYNFRSVRGGIVEARSGHVDADIAKAYPREYGLFIDYVNKNDKELYAKAREKGEVKFDYEKATDCN